MEIIIGRQGTQALPITDPTVSRQHCKATLQPDGSYVVENLSPGGTRVDGVEIVRTVARPDSTLQLGAHFTAKLSDLVGTPAVKKEKALGDSDPDMPSYNIAPLRRVWEDFNTTNITKADEQRKINLTRTGLGIFTMCAMPTIFFFGPVGYVLTGLGVLGNVYSFAGMKNSETAAERQARQEQFDDQWVCPNPECGRSLPARNYRMLLRNYQSCPYCKCKYVEV